MPAFSFEKLSPPVERAPAPPSAPIKRHRGIIVQLLDRLTESKLEKNTRAFEMETVKTRRSLPR